MTAPAQSQNAATPQIFQVFTGRWECANYKHHSGTVLKRLAKQPFVNLQAIGINTIYLLGLFDNRGPILVSQEEGVSLHDQPDRCPSIFALTDQKKINPLLGTLPELKSLVRTLQKQKFKVIVDFVPNHTGLAHPWIKAHPEYYWQNEQGLVKEFSGDVAKLDYSNPILRAEMIEILKTYASWGIDGVRCDMAHFIPMDFWQDAITQIRQNTPDFMWIAESYDASVFDWSHTRNLISAGFQLVYHQAFYQNCKNALKSNFQEDYLDEHISFVDKDEHLKNHLLNYVSNHDDSFPGQPEQVLPLLTRTRKRTDAWLFYNGILCGQTNRLAHHWLDILPDKKNELFCLSDSLVHALEKPRGSHTLVLDIGGSKIESGVVDDQFVLTNIKRQKTPKENLREFMAGLKVIIDDYCLQNQAISGLAIAIPGVLSNQGEIEFAGGNLPFLNGCNIKTELAKITSLPCVVDNDANCFALGEALYGAAKDCQTVVGITWGTGIGSGIVIDKKLFKGKGGAGEIGHIPVATANQSIRCECGKANCLEVFASGSAIQKQYQELGGKIADATVQQIVESSETIAKALIEQAVIYMAEAIVTVINLLDPDCIVLGGGISQIDANVFDHLKDLINNQEIKTMHKTRILKHSLKNAALVGAVVERS